MDTFKFFVSNLRKECECERQNDPVTQNGGALKIVGGQNYKPVGSNE